MVKKSTVKFLVALASAFVLMIVFRALAMTVYTIGDDTLAPHLLSGDRVLVNRWSYGLRVSGGSLFSYGRIGRQKVSRGDLVAVDGEGVPAGNSQPAIFRCGALPGDTIKIDGVLTVVPGLEQCADADYYLMEQVGEGGAHHQGFVREEQIIGRVTHVIYRLDPSLPLWQGWESSRTFMPL